MGYSKQDVGEIFISHACDKVGNPNPVDICYLNSFGLGWPKQAILA